MSVIIEFFIPVGFISFKSKPIKEVTVDFLTDAIVMAVEFGVGTTVK